MIKPLTIPGSQTNDLIFFDLETTGLDPRTHEILEIGAVRYAHDLAEERGTYACKIIPMHPETALAEALAVNTYSPESWADAIPLRTGLEGFLAFGAGGMLAGYNITFDWEFLHAALAGEGLENVFPYHRLDVFSVAYEAARRMHQTTSLDLGSLCELFGVPPPPKPHRALTDAQAAAALLLAIRQKETPVR